MDINHHVFFNKEKAPDLLLLLQKNNIPYEEYAAVIFDISESDPNWPIIHRLLAARNISYLSETSFTKKELSQAKWLRVRSQWHNGYPQPENTFEYEKISYLENSKCPECGCGLCQVAPFRLKNQPKWGKRHFFSLNWVADELFIDETAKNVLTKTGLTGFSFREVRNKNGKEVFPGVFQLYIEATAKPGFIEGRQDLHEILTCPACKTKRFHPNGIGMHAFYEEALEGMPDICKTGEYFGWGKASEKLILIRQSVYRTLVDNHLDRGLVFQPIELLSLFKSVNM